ncbi:MAG: hypothetical protein WBX15_19005 [Thermoanaerobaculia bacterium]
MTYLVERLAELRKHLDHLRNVRPKVTDAESLARDLSLHNDVLFSLLMVSQLVIDIAGEIAARKGERFESYADAIRSLDPHFSHRLVARRRRVACMQGAPGFGTKA